MTPRGLESPACPRIKSTTGPKNRRKKVRLILRFGGYNWELAATPFAEGAYARRREQHASRRRNYLLHSRLGPSSADQSPGTQDEPLLNYCPARAFRRPAPAPPAWRRHRRRSSYLSRSYPRLRGACASGPTPAIQGGSILVRLLDLPRQSAESPKWPSRRISRIVHAFSKPLDFRPTSPALPSPPNPLPRLDITPCPAVFFASCGPLRGWDIICFMFRPFVPVTRSKIERTVGTPAHSICRLLSARLFVLGLPCYLSSFLPRYLS